MISIRSLTALLVIVAAAVAACAEEETAGEKPLDYEDAIEAREHNTVDLNGIRYRVVMFRQINPRLASDGALYEGPLPEEGVGVYAAFLRACNDSDERRTPTSEVKLEDAFGESYPRLRAVSDEAFDYEPEPLRPDNCLPPDDGAADRAFPGAAILFAIPFDDLGNRPFILELQDRGEAGRLETRRIEVDL